MARKTFNVRVFASVLYGRDRDGSDLDLLGDTLPGATLFDLGTKLENFMDKLIENHRDKILIGATEL